MKKMYRIALLAVAGTMAFAQTKAPAENPPDGVEQAVRTRASEFYTLMVAQKYRQAEAYVAEDTKDYYYAGSKPEIRKYEVVKVEFSDHFTHAKVFTRCVEPVVMAGFPPGDMTVTVPTLWKLEGGNWFVYENPEKIRNPSGVSIVPPSAPRVEVPPTPGAVSTPDLKDLPKDGAFVYGKVRADKTEIKLSPGSTETVTIMNRSTGPVTLEYGYPLGGVDAKLDRTQLGKDEKATLTLTAGKTPSSGFYYLRVMPTDEAIRINVQAQ